MRRVCLVVAVFLLLPAPARGQALMLNLFSEYLESLRIQAGIPALAAIIVGPRAVVWDGAYGQQDVDQAVAARSDTPFHVDGLTQVMTATMVLRCVEERQLSLDDPAGRFMSDSTEPDATLRQLLSHTSGPPGNLVFNYRPERLRPLSFAIRACTGDSYRETLARLLTRLAMRDSVPGPDVIHPARSGEAISDSSDLARYRGVLERLAVPYAVDSRGRPSPSTYPATTLTASSGLISTVRDFARFDLALRHEILLSAGTLREAWEPAAGAGGRPLPHALGWFVQPYHGESVVWQFGVGEDASSSMVITLAGRGLTLILMANSDRLVRPFKLSAGDLTQSPFARLFLGLFVR